MSANSESMSLPSGRRPGKRPLIAWLPYVFLVGGLVGVPWLSSSPGSRFIERMADINRHFLPALGPLWSEEVLKEICLAAAVAGLATIAIENLRIHVFTEELEELVAKKLNSIEEATKDAVARGPLPRPYYEYVQKMMLSSTFIGSDWTITIRLEPDVHRSGCVQRSIDQQYMLKNLSGTEQQYVLEHRSTVFGIRGTGAITCMRAKLQHTGEWLVNLPSSGDESIGIVKDGCLVFQRTVPVPRDATIMVEKGSVDPLDAHDFTLFLVRHAHTHLRCAVDHPDGLTISMHFPEAYGAPISFSPLTGERQLRPGWKRSEWDFPFPLLPGSTVALEWSPAARGE